jgi:selenide,water dikinase
MFSGEHHPDLVVGLGVPDDAAVYRLSATRALVATVDFFAPVVDDAETYGAIAAANAMSDVFAMGGEVAFALNVAAFPEDLPPAVVTAILRGGGLKVAEAGGAIAGGHTIWDKEPKYGLAVLGFVHPKKMLSKAGLAPGDVLYLTKPLGAGTILSASKQKRADPAWAEGAIASMLRLNRGAARLAVAHGVRAGTDVTGFGLLGHLWEMVSRSAVAAELDGAAVPLLAGARESSEMGVHTGGEGRNRAWAEQHATFAAGIDPTVAALISDPQTSGGLLLGCRPRRAKAMEAAFSAAGEPLWRIGRAVAGEAAIRVR